MFLITMAGLSSRFFKQGYDLPKYQLMLGEKTVFEWAVLSFKHYFANEKFVFVARDVYDTPRFIEEKCKSLGIANFSVVVLEDETEGQAETAYLALIHESPDEPVFIFNIDTIRYDYRKPDFIDECDGYLEVFRGEGEHWSFVEPGDKNQAIRTTEKERISDLCSDGLYYFKTAKIFADAFLLAKKNNDRVRGEFYVSPLYNSVIASGRDIRYEVIALDQIDFCGTPEEYEELKLRLG